MSDVLTELFEDQFAHAIAEEEKKSGVPAEEWTVTGRKTAKTPNGNDFAWWRAEGPAMLQRYIDWRAETRWDIWTTPDGQEAIELAFEVPWGEETFRGYIDRIFILPTTGELVVVDLKSGSMQPPNRQLGEYACAVEVMYGVRPRYGAYFMTRTGRCDVVPLDRPGYQFDVLVKWGAALRRGIENEVFIPHPSSLCNSCGYRDVCIEMQDK